MRTFDQNHISILQVVTKEFGGCNRSIHTFHDRYGEAFLFCSLSDNSAARTNRDEVIYYFCRALSYRFMIDGIILAKFKHVP